MPHHQEVILYFWSLFSRKMSKLILQNKENYIAAILLDLKKLKRLKQKAQLLMKPK